MGWTPDLLGAFKTLDLEANVSPALCLKENIMKCSLKVPVLYGRQEATKGVLIDQGIQIEKVCLV